MKKSSRSQERGLTLVEVLIVMAIAVFLVSGMVFASGQIQRSRLRSSSTRVAAAMKVAWQRASATGRDLRLVIDPDQNTIWIEESRQKMLIQSGDKVGTGGADPATTAEKLAQEEATRITLGPQSPRAGFTPVDGPAGQPQPLYPGIMVKAIDATHETKPRTSGRGYIYFFGSDAERASVVLHIAGEAEDKDAMSVVLSPLSGKATIQMGAVYIPHPRDDAEASEAEDDGR
ncbi:MAG: pilus assembly FimT family protein [Polyangiales bacterium]